MEVFGGVALITYYDPFFRWTKETFFGMTDL
jgi:hypothetical protein